MAEAPARARRRINRRMVVVGAVFFVVLIGELFLYAWVRMQCVRAGYDIGVLMKEQRQLAELQDSLKVELARLKSPQRITRIARDNLGMTLPAPKQVLVMP
jgi:cell division protein FtsL